MSLMLNVDPAVRRGEEIQFFEVSHGDEKLIMKLYVQPSTGKLKMVFDGPKSFAISRFREPLTSTPRQHDRSPDSE